MSSGGRKCPAGEIQVCERQQREHLGPVLGDAAIAHLSIAELALHDTKHMHNDMRTTWCVILIAASAMMGTIDVLHAQPEENSGRNEFLRSCASCHGVSGKGDGPVASRSAPGHPI